MNTKIIPLPSGLSSNLRSKENIILPEKTTLDKKTPTHDTTAHINSDQKQPSLENFSLTELGCKLQIDQIDTKIPMTVILKNGDQINIIFSYLNQFEPSTLYGKNTTSKELLIFKKNNISSIKAVPRIMKWV